MDQSPRKPKRFYHWNRELHLYLGLIVSPFLLIFAVSTILLNHGMKPSPVENKTTVPIELKEGLEGEALVADVLDQLNFTGEVFGRGKFRNGKTTINISKPGNVKFVTVDIEKKEVLIANRSFGFIDTLGTFTLTQVLTSTPHGSSLKRGDRLRTERSISRYFSRYRESICGLFSELNGKPVSSRSVLALSPLLQSFTHSLPNEDEFCRN